MLEAGQFLTGPGAVFGFLSGFGIIGLGLGLWTLSTLRSRFAERLVPGMDAADYFQGIAAAAVISVVLTLVLQTVSVLFLGTTARLTNTAVRSMDQSDSSGEAVLPGPRLPLRGLGAGIRRNRRLTGILAGLAVAAVLLLVVGAGYAFTALNLSFLGHLAAFSAGVGLVEEVSKAAAGFVILYGILSGGSGLTPEQFQRRVLAAFGMAGLGFGAGEALFYFGTYADTSSGPGIYAVRAVWCVSLHGAWTLITGELLAKHLPREAAGLEASGGDLTGRVIVSCIPALLLHALYNTCCLHGSGFCWVAGGVSLLTAGAILEDHCEVQTPEADAG